jgi:hypothetical protein
MSVSTLIINRGGFHFIPLVVGYWLLLVAPTFRSIVMATANRGDSFVLIDRCHDGVGPKRADGGQFERLEQRGREGEGQAVDVDQSVGTCRRRTDEAIAFIAGQQVGGCLPGSALAECDPRAPSSLLIAFHLRAMQSDPRDVLRFTLVTTGGR